MKNVAAPVIEVLALIFMIFALIRGWGTKSYSPEDLKTTIEFFGWLILYWVISTRKE